MTATNVNSIKPDQYAQWLNTPALRRLLSLEAAWLKQWLEPLYGCHLIYTGIDPEPRFLKRGRTVYQSVLGLPWANGVAPCAAQISDDAWPLADNSVDVVVLQHSLDMSSKPHQLIREATRVLVPNGYLIVCGFNPLSPFGAWRWLRTFSSTLPWLTSPIAPARLHDWLMLLDLKVEQTFYCAHTWPVRLGSEKTARRIDRVLAGNMWLPANAYIMVARKTVAGMTAIRPRRFVFGDKSFGIPVAAASQVWSDCNGVEVSDQ